MQQNIGGCQTWGEDATNFMAETEMRLSLLRIFSAAIKGIANL